MKREPVFDPLENIIHAFKIGFTKFDFLLILIQKLIKLYQSILHKKVHIAH